MELWVAFSFGAGVGALLGYMFGRRRRAPAPPAPRPTPRPGSGEVRRVVLNEGAANVLNALNNRLAAIEGLVELLREAGGTGDAERQRALGMLQGEVRRAAEISQHFLELAERETTLKELGVKAVRAAPGGVTMVACPRVQLTDILTRLVDFALRRLREAPAPRELRVAISEAGPSVAIALWDSGAPLSVEAEQRLVSPFRFTYSGGGGEIEFALARALAQSTGGNIRLRPRGGGNGAEVVVTLPKSTLSQLPATAPTPATPPLRILVVDDDVANRDAMRRLLQRMGHDVVAVEDGLAAAAHLTPTGASFDAVVTDLQMPRLGGQALYEQVIEERPHLARRFVFVTGDSARAESRRFLEACGQPTVLKPYDLQELMSAIRAVTSSASTTP